VKSNLVMLVNLPLLRTKVSLASPKLRCTRLAYHTLAVPASLWKTLTRSLQWRNTLAL